MNDKELENRIDDLTVNSSSITDSLEAIYCMILNDLNVNQDQLKEINQISGLVRAVKELSAKNDRILDEINSKAYKKGE